MEPIIRHQCWKDRAVVISGLGIFTPLGRNAAEICDAILNGGSSIAPSVNINIDELPCLTSEFLSEDTFGLPQELTRRTDRAVWFTMRALEQALESAALKISDLVRDRTAVVVGTSHSGVQHCEKVLKAASQGRTEGMGSGARSSGSSSGRRHEVIAPAPARVFW